MGPNDKKRIVEYTGVDLCKFAEEKISKMLSFKINKTLNDKIIKDMKSKITHVTVKKNYEFKNEEFTTISSHITHAPSTNTNTTSNLKISNYNLRGEKLDNYLSPNFFVAKESEFNNLIDTSFETTKKINLYKKEIETNTKNLIFENSNEILNIKADRYIECLYKYEKIVDLNKLPELYKKTAELNSKIICDELSNPKTISWLKLNSINYENFVNNVTYYSLNNGIISTIDNLNSIFG